VSDRDRTLVAIQATLGLAFVVNWLRSQEAVSLPWHVASWTALATGGSVGAIALWQLRRSFRVAPTPRRDGRLVTHGIYGFLRHPMYTSVVLVVLGLALVRPDALVLGSALVNLLFYLGKARYEEGLLLDHYPGYAAYRRRTIGVLPGW